MHKKLLFAPAALIITASFVFLAINARSAAPAIYYVDPFFGNDSNSGSIEAAWKTIDRVNRASLNPGDSVLFKRGGIWREELRVPRGGEAGNYITFGAYGAGEKPIISGANIITGWTLFGGNTYYKNSIPVEPNQVFYNGNFLNEKNGGWQSLGLNEWDWNSNTLYINIGANPGGQTIEAGQRRFCIESDGNNYIKYENLIVQYANEDGLYHHGWNFTGLVIDSVHARYNGNPGVDFRGIYMKGGSDITVKNSEADHNGWNGIGFSSWESTTARSNWVLENSSAHHNYHSGFDFQAGSTGISGITARYSKGYENYHNGMYVASNSGVDISNANIYYNAFYKNKRAGLHIDDHDGSLPFVSNVKVYNNVMHYNGHESGIWGGGLAAKMTNSSVINNIFYSNQVVKGGSTEVIVNDGGGSANNFNYNLIYNPNLSNLVQWDNSYFSYSQLAPNGINANGLNNVQPVLRDPSANDFALSASSPCIDKGFGVNLTADLAGNQVAYNGVPDIGAYEYRPAPLPPTLVQISSIDSSSITYNSAIISWTTNIEASSQAEYGITSSYGSKTIEIRSNEYPISAFPEKLAKNHSIGLSGLQPNTTYHYRVISKDSNGNSATSGDYIFTTQSSPGAGKMIYYRSGFETGNINEWIFDDGGNHTGAGYATNEISHSGSYAWRAQNSSSLPSPHNISSKLLRWRFSDNPAYYSGWFYWPADYNLGSGGYANIFQFKETGSPFDPLWVVAAVPRSINGQTKDAFGLHDPKNAIIYDSNTEVPKGGWHHLEAYYNKKSSGGGITVYLDGDQLFDKQNINTAGASGSSIMWGVGNYGGAGIDKYIYWDDVIVSDYQIGASIPTPTPTPSPTPTPAPTPAQKPYPGPNPHQIPGTIEAENFDQGGEGAAYHDLDAQNRGGVYRSQEGPDIESCSEGGFNIGWTTPGEWLEYTVDIAQAGNYDIEIRNAIVNQGSYIRVEFDGADKTGPIPLAPTGGWQTWNTYKKTDVNLSAGTQTMRIYFSSGSGEGMGNINWIRISSSAAFKSSDLNSDTRVNSIDFGILMSWWGSNARPKSDINQDGYVNSVDFGIMLSQWTG